MRTARKFTALLLLTSLLAAVTCAAAFAPTSAYAETTVIRVGFFSFPGYHILNTETETRSGYGYEFLQLLAKHADWRYEYKYYDESYADNLVRLQNGDVDVVTSVSKTPEREALFNFSDKDIGKNSTIFTVKAGNSAVVKGDYSTYEGLKIGMLANNSKNKTFEEFAAGKFDFEPVYFENDGELSAALMDGTVDGIVAGSLRSIENEWLIESLSSSPFYICTTKTEAGTALMAEINAAIDKLDLSDPEWRDTLQDKYYSTDASGEIALTPEERDYLSALKTSGEPLTVLMNPDRAPYSYFEGTEARGIFPRLFESMTASLGLDFSYIYLPPTSRERYYDLRAKGEIDIVLDFTDDLSLAESNGYKVTDIYYTTTHTMLKRKNFGGVPKVFSALRYADDPHTNYLSTFVGTTGSTVRYYDTMDECVAAVKRGDVDATIALSYVSERYKWQDENDELLSELIGEASSAYSIGVKAESGAVLLSILDKCVAAYDRGAVSSIVTEEVSKFRPSENGGIIYFLRRNPVYIVFIVTAVLLLLFAAAMLVVRSLNQRKLKRKVEEATAKLQTQTEELSNALHAADAANRSKTTFLNNMSHDIRTPMNAIIGFTGLATTHIDEKERALDYLSKISQASNHLLSLINDVLDMSRIESGMVHIEERPENLADILQGLRNIIQSDIHSKKLELFIDTMDVTDEEVYCDKLRLNQILLNLTSNAIKFTKSGGSVSVRITQKPCPREGYGRYEFRVTDTGIGMSPEFMKTVFDPFTRERNSTVSGIQGTGLGMAITKNIVDMMGGTIEVESEQGKGTEFTVTLDLRLGGSGHEETFSLEELNGLYALVVDDDLISCQSVSKMLRKIGMHAEWTVTGREAIVRTTEAIEMGRPFEVFIVDWAMPDMDGIATVKEIRSIIGDDSPIILMSAYDWADIEHAAREAGVNGFISKPLFASDLHRALEKSLGKAAAKSEKPQKKSRFEGKRVLLAEDNELNREIAVEILTEAGFEVDTAENGKVALEKVEGSAPGRYDLVLMDVQMPIMDGYEAARKIRALGNTALSSIPIIAMTANAFEEDKSNAFAAGMNGHLAKPIDTDAMFTLLGKVLGTPEDEASTDGEDKDTAVSGNAENTCEKENDNSKKDNDGHNDNGNKENKNSKKGNTGGEK